VQVLDRSFRILDALAASDDAVSPGPVFRVQKGRVVELSRAVIKAADDLSADLGHVKSEPRSRKAISSARRFT